MKFTGNLLAVTAMIGLSGGAAAQTTIPLTLYPGGTFVGQLASDPSGVDCQTTGGIIPGHNAIATIVPAGPTFPPSATSNNITIRAVALGSTSIKVIYTASAPCTPTSGTNIYVVNVVSLPTVDKNPNTQTVGHPISTATGELFGHDEVPDLDLGGPLDLAFLRYYASLLVPNGVTSALGSNWMHNFDVKATVNGNAATVTLFRGKTVQFTQSSGAWQLSSVERLPYQFAAVAGGFQFLDAASHLIYTFSSSGALASIQNRSGVTLTVTQAAGGVGPSQVSDGLGRTLTFTYTGSNLTRVQDQSGRSVSFQYTSGNLTAWTNANGHLGTYAYNASGTGLMTVETRPAGNQPFTQTFDSQGRVTGQTDSFSTTMTLAYAAANGGATFSEPGGLNLTAVNDSQFNLTFLSDPGGGSSKYTYDASNRPTSVTDRMGQKTTATYDAASGLPASVTDELGNTTSFVYSTLAVSPFTFYDLSAIHFADGSTLNFARDSLGNITIVTDQAGNFWNATYTAQGEIATLTNPSGGVTHFTYAADGTLTSVQAPSGDTTNIAYDVVSRPNLITNPDSTTRSLQYDGDDNATQFTDEQGKGTASSFDANDNTKTVTDPLSNVTSFARDTDDRLTSVTDPLGNATVQAFDSSSRLHSVTNAAGNSATYSYDSLNRVTGVVDASGNGVSYSLDAEGRVLVSADALSRTTKLTRDARGLVTGVTTANNEQFSRSLDALGRTVATKDALNRAAQFTWDPRGLLAAEALPGGVNASFGFNAMGLRTSITDPDANVWNQAFDASGRPVSSTDPLGQQSSTTYDSRQRPSVTTFPNGSVQYQYDPAGHLLSETYSDGTVLNYTYDADGRMTAGTGLALGYNAAGDLISSNGLQIGRDAAHRIASVTYAPGKVVTYTYNNRGFLSQVADWIGGTTFFTYDAAGQLTSTVYANGVTQTNTYDLNGRPLTYNLSQAGTPIYSISLTRDALGRVTSDSRSRSLFSITPDAAPGTFELAYNAAAEVIGSQYDALGRLTGAPLRGYVWDLASRLTSYSGSDGSASFTYDALGQRTSRTSNGLTQTYGLNYALALPSVSVVRIASVDQTYYVWLPDGTLLESIGADGTRRFYHYDESGNTNALTDGATGAVTEMDAVTPYGEEWEATGYTGNPFVFQGRFGVMREGTTNLYYMRARYFDATTARFIARDPLLASNAKAIDPYQFVFGNPIEHMDASGMEPDERTDVKPFTPLLAFLNLPASATSYAPLNIDTKYSPLKLHSPDELVTPPLTTAIPSFPPTTSIESTDNLRTTLLFPYVTNVTGFETGIGIINTTTDNLGEIPGVSTAATPISPACTTNFYPGGTATQPAVYTTPVIGVGGTNTGSVAAATLSTMSGAANFTGYAIASCPFPEAHGFAYIVDNFGTPSGTAEGYLAVVVGAPGER